MTGNPRIPQLPAQELDFVPFGGGLDLVTPAWSARPGTLRDAKNYEIGINGGYDRIAGYERFDGQASPSDGQYRTVDVTITGVFSAGDTITGATSGATAVLILVDADASGQDFLVMTKVTGTFVAEDLNVGGSPQGSITEAPTTDGGSTALLHAQYKNLAADEYRDDIGAVPGAGSILGVWMLNDVVYAWRNNVGVTEAEMYKSSASGWTAVPLGRELSFTSGGTTEIAEGDTITGASSGATALITRVVLESGTWAGGDAAGRLIFASQTGTFQSENLDVGASANLATIAGDSSAITMSPNGSFEFVTHNFGGLAGEDRIYGCDGVNRGFEFDGSVFVPIDTGMTTDTPNHVIAHKNHLFFSYEGSAQHSGIGTPYIWSPVYGASELAIGDTITGFQSQPGSEGNAALAIFSRNKINILYGTSSADWNLTAYREELGAYAGSIQQVGFTMMLDDRGLVALHTSQAFGNFEHAALSELIQPWLIARKSGVNCSMIARDKNQYRLFFDDSYALYVTLAGNKVLGMMPIDLTNEAVCSFSLEKADGTEMMVFGSDNGYVYELDKGTSFDGEPIIGELNIHYHHSKTPGVYKGYKGVQLEVGGAGYAAFNFTYELDYTSVERTQPDSQTATQSFSSTRWDSFTWDAFNWDGSTLSPSRLEMNGSGQNVALIILSDSDYHEPTQFSGALMRLVKRRLVR